ncbi:MAG: hypothetical protein WKG07_30755 [Hymenobacter sp.]
MNGEHAQRRLPDSDGHHRGHAGGQLQPRHAGAELVRRREMHA